MPSAAMQGRAFRLWHNDPSCQEMILFIAEAQLDIKKRPSSSSLMNADWRKKKKKVIKFQCSTKKNSRILLKL